MDVVEKKKKKPKALASNSSLDDLLDADMDILPIPSSTKSSKKKDKDKEKNKDKEKDKEATRVNTVSNGGSTPACTEAGSSVGVGHQNSFDDELDQVENPKINVKSPARGRKERESAANATAASGHSGHSGAGEGAGVSDQEVKSLRDKLSASDSRERILSQHLLDNQTEMVELQQKHEKETAAVRESIAKHEDSGRKMALLSQLVTDTANTLSNASYETDKGDVKFQQQVAEALAANKSFIETLPLEDKRHVEGLFHMCSEGVDAMFSGMNTLRAERDAIRHDFNQFKLEMVSGQKGPVAYLSEENARLTSSLEDAAAEYALLSKKAAKQSTTLKSNEIAITDSKTLMDTYEEELGTLRKEIELARMTISTTEKERDQLSEQHTTLSSAMEKSKGDNDKVRLKMRTLLTERDDLLVQSDVLQADLSAYKEDSQGKARQLEDKETLVAELSLNRNSTQGEADNLKILMIGLTATVTKTQGALTRLIETLLLSPSSDAFFEEFLQNQRSLQDVCSAAKRGSKSDDVFANVDALAETKANKYSSDFVAFVTTSVPTLDITKGGYSMAADRFFVEHALPAVCDHLVALDKEYQRVDGLYDKDSKQLSRLEEGMAEGKTALDSASNLARSREETIDTLTEKYEADLLTKDEAHATLLREKEDQWRVELKQAQIKLGNNAHDSDSRTTDLTLQLESTVSKYEGQISSLQEEREVEVKALIRQQELVVRQLKSELEMKISPLLMEIDELRQEREVEVSVLTHQRESKMKNLIKQHEAELAEKDLLIEELSRKHDVIVSKLTRKVQEISEDFDIKDTARQQLKASELKVLSKQYEGDISLLRNQIEEMKQEHREELLAAEEQRLVAIKLATKKNEAELQRLNMQWESRQASLAVQLEDMKEQREADLAGAVVQRLV
jgi:hypothetical protein